MAVGTGDLRDVDDTVGQWLVELSLHVLLVKVAAIIFILSVILAAGDGDGGVGLHAGQGRNSPELEAHHASLHHKLCSGCQLNS